MGKECNEQREVEQVFHRFAFLLVHIDRITKRGEGVKRNTCRQDDIGFCGMEIGPEQIYQVLEEEGFFNEERFAMAFAHGKFAIKKWGRIKIKQELKQKRVSDYCLKKALQQIDEEEYIQTLKKIIETKRRLIKEPNQTKLKFKLMSYALSKGYEKDLIFDVLNDLDD